MGALSTFPVLTLLQVMSWVSPISNLVGKDRLVRKPGFPITEVGRTAVRSRKACPGGRAGKSDRLSEGTVLQVSVSVSRQLTSRGQVLYVFEVVWTLTIPIIKTSILLLYNRIFPVPRVRLATYFVGFFVITWLLWAGISTIAQCTPIPYFWDRTIAGGHCINNDAFYIAAGAVNVFTDFAIIAIPIPVIWNLQKISTVQKFGFVAIFSLGGFVCVISIIRLVYLGRISADDITWTDAWGGLWSSIEVSLDVVGACLPVVAPGIVKMTRQRDFSWLNLRSSRWASDAKHTEHSNPHVSNGRSRGHDGLQYSDKANKSWLTDSSFTRGPSEGSQPAALEHV